MPVGPQPLASLASREGCSSHVEPAIALARQVMPIFFMFAASSTSVEGVTVLQYAAGCSSQEGVAATLACQVSLGRLQVIWSQAPKHLQGSQSLQQPVG